MAEKKKETKTEAQGAAKTELLKTALNQIEKEHGKGSIMRLGDSGATTPIETISSGAISVDIALGVGGFPKSRIVEVYGPESSGKTTLALTAIANAQKTGGTAVLVDVEYAFDPSWAKTLGVDVDNLILSQPDSGEQALEIVETLARSGAVDIIVLDSVAALAPQAEIEGDMGDSHVGLQARMMSQAMRKLTPIISKTNTCLIFINQLRMKIGVMFGNPETTTGGNALKYYASVRIDIRKKETIKEGEDILGNRVHVKVVKNKVSPPFKEADFDIIYNEGISTAGDLLDVATADGIIEKSGSWFSYNGERIGQGRENARAYLSQNPQIFAELDKTVRTKHGLLK
ncbi:MAG: recombinase RecA [Chitinivibrionia bacterium]|nr:recombinase RecA [Chitinivibrionia bacterium]